MKFKFNNDIPIHQQLVEQISYYIVSGYLKPADKLPSVRDLAVMAEVNHNTIQKALFEIENTGLIITNRTNGKFVTEDVYIINNIRNKILNDKVASFLNDLENIGVYSVKLEIKKEKDEEVDLHGFTRM
ncbi:MAG: GntR family transcriptional regulator [Bacilli bacterium]|nr:GntR family transcriptional regulator [Bacilli bacterium]